MNLKALGGGGRSGDWGKETMNMKQEQFDLIKKQLGRLAAVDGGFYQKKFRDFDVTSIQSQGGFREAPLYQQGRAARSISAGVAGGAGCRSYAFTPPPHHGTPIIIPYTKQDVEDWAVMFERCYRTAGLTNRDRVQITPGYGLWTAGIGFQAGVERLGAMAIPMGPGNTDQADSDDD